jgi:hypothetical protein
MTETEGTPTPQSRRQGHPITIYLAQPMADLTRMATMKAHLADLDGNAEGCLTETN